MDSLRAMFLMLCWVDYVFFSNLILQIPLKIVLITVVFCKFFSLFLTDIRIYKQNEKHSWMENGERIVEVRLCECSFFQQYIIITLHFEQGRIKRMVTVFHSKDGQEYSVWKYFWFLMVMWHHSRWTSLTAALYSTSVIWQRGAGIL